jgi:dTDP-4-amino-4,6-dideoxygalactose transaminase
VAGASFASATILSSPSTALGAPGKPAILGGEKVYSGKWPSWPQGSETMEDLLKEVLQGQRWTRIAGTGNLVIDFEKAWARMLGVKHAVATNGGTTAIHCALKAIDLQPGDEVLVSPVEFITGASLPFTFYALPVFVDVDRESSQMDPAKIEQRVTDRTKAILPCHWGGAPADMGRIMAIAKKHNLFVIEDACQAHLGEYQGKKLGTIGDIGCFSHQQSKPLPCGEGGSFVGDNEEIMAKAYAWHDYGRAIGSWETHKPARAPINALGLNYKMTEFQGAILLGGLKALEEQAQLRNENANYLRELLKDIPGIEPQKLYEGTTRGSYYFMDLRYDKKCFNNLPRATFAKAMSAEGVAISVGRAPLSTLDYARREINTPVFRSLYAKEKRDWYLETIPCPVAEQLMAEETLRIHGTRFLATKTEMEAFSEAIRKIQAHSKALSSV